MSTISFSADSPLTPLRARRRFALASLVIVAGLAACDGTRAVHHEPMQQVPEPPPGFPRFVALAAGSMSACGLTADSLTWCWGLGHLTGEGATTRPVLIAAPKLGSIAIGPHHEFRARDLLCGTTAAGDVICRGASAQGQVTVPGSAEYSGVTVGAAVCALASDGGGRCWRYTSLAGVLGAASFDHIPLGTPVDVDGGRAYTAISAGASNACALTSDRETWCWGYNHSLQIGTEHGDAIAFAPARLSAAQAFTTVSVGPLHTCALTADGRAYCWGLSARGRLGKADPPSMDCPGVGDINTGGPLPCSGTPVEVAGGLTFTAISTGGAHACALDAEGAAYCWGTGAWGQMGTGHWGIGTWSAMPQPVAGDLRFRHIVAGEFFTCAIAANDATYCWGGNQSGELGIGEGFGYVATVPHPVAAP